MPSSDLRNISGPLGPFVRRAKIENASKGFTDEGGFVFEVAGGIDKAARIEFIPLGGDSSIRQELEIGESPRCAGMPILCQRVYPHKDLRILVGYL